MVLSRSLAFIRELLGNDNSIIRNLCNLPYCTDDDLWLSDRLAHEKYEPTVLRIPTNIDTPPIAIFAACAFPNNVDDPTDEAPATVDNTIHGKAI